MLFNFDFSKSLNLVLFFYSLQIDGYRANKKFLDTFPADVETAEKRTNGDPDIINSYQDEPKRKSNTWNDLFVDPNKLKKKATKETAGQSFQARKTDHEVKIMEQKKSPCTPGASNSYTCSVCSFVTTRLNVLILHNKTHKNDQQASTSVITPKKTPAKAPKTKKMHETKQVPIDDFFDDDLDSLDEETTPKAKKKKKPTKSPKTVTPKQQKTKKTNAGPKKGGYVKKEKSGNIAQAPIVKNEITKNLLADWSDDELTLDDVTKPAEIESKTLKETSPALTFDDLKNSLEGKDIDMISSPPKVNEKPSSSGVAPIPPRRVSVPKKQKQRFLEDELTYDKQLLSKKKKADKKPTQQSTHVESKKDDTKKTRDSQQNKLKSKLSESSASMCVEIEKESKRTSRSKTTQNTSKSKSHVKDVNELFNSLKQEDDSISKKKSKNEHTKSNNNSAELSEITFNEVSNSTKREPSCRAQRKTSIKAESMYPIIDPIVTDSVESQIAALLDETAPPVSESKLPPKERNKRILKTQAKSAKDSPNSIPSTDTSPSKTESELQIAETLTQLPRTAIQFSTKKEVIKKPAIEMPSNKRLYENPRKRPLLAFGDSSKQQQPKSDQTVQKQSTEATATIPKKRKTEYTTRFEEQHQSQQRSPEKSQKRHNTDESKSKTAESSLYDIEKMEIVYYNENLDESGIIEEVVDYSPSPPSKKQTKNPAVNEMSKSINITQRPSSVTSLPLKTTEIRRLSSPMTTIASKKGTTSGPQTKSLKIITKADGTKKVIEEFRSTHAPSNTQNVILRASSSSPLAKFRNDLPKGQIVQKGKIIQAASNKIVITSKGQLMTTTSPGMYIYFF